MKKLFSYMMVCGAMMTAVLGFTSCEDDLDVQQAYPFTVEFLIFRLTVLAQQHRLA